MADKNMLPILIGGGVVLAIVAYMFLKKSAPKPVATNTGFVPQSTACTLPGGIQGVMTATGCLPKEAAAVAAGAGSIINALSPLATLATK